MAVSVHNRVERSRYEIEVDGVVAGFADYRDNGREVVFPHTVIDPGRRGQGLGEQLVVAALDDVRGSGRTVVAQCWFVHEFIEAHPEYADLIAA
jgi:predicted GNAT family acetyltransferase